MLKQTLSYFCLWSIYLKLYMRTIFLIFLFVLPIHLFSQGFIGKNKRYVKKYLQKEARKNDTHITITDQDSILLYSIRDERYRPVDFIYRFNNAGRCSYQKVMAGCDSCLQKYLKEVLDRKKYEWKKINENQYVSKYSEFLILELPVEKDDFSYVILKAGWNRESYRMLMEK